MVFNSVPISADVKLISGVASSNDLAGVEPTGRVAGEFNDSSLPFVMHLSSPTHAYYLDLRQNPGAGEVFGQDSNINVQSLIGPYGHTGHPQPGSNSDRRRHHGHVC